MFAFLYWHRLHLIILVCQSDVTLKERGSERLPYAKFFPGRCSMIWSNYPVPAIWKAVVCSAIGDKSGDAVRMWLFSAGCAYIMTLTRGSWLDMFHSNGSCI